MILDGVRVLDLSHTFAGPLATMMLGDLGADVIKVERPDVGDESRTWPQAVDHDRSTYFCALNRNKRSIVLDLIDHADREVLYQLARTSDLVVSNFQPHVAQKLGVDEEAMRRQGADPFYLSITGFGSGPYQDLPAYDPIIQAMSGFMSVTGEIGGPPLKSMIPIADVLTGVNTYAAALAGLLAKERGRDTRASQVSMMNVMVSSLTIIGTTHLFTGLVPPRSGRRNPARVPSSGLQCADGVYVQIAPNQRQWPAFCEAVGRPDWTTDARFGTNADRIAHEDILYDELDVIFASQRSEYWIERLRSAGVPCGPVMDLRSVFSDEHVRTSGAVVATNIGEPVAEPLDLLAGPVPDLARPPDSWLAPPHLGEHTEEIRAELQRSS